MLQTGLVSVTFRKLEPAEIITLVRKAGLHGIEWGGDVHVPMGDIVKAREVFSMTAGAGLDVSAYGSYYRVGCQENGPDDFKKILESAVELHAPTIRVWAGNRASIDADEYWWDRVITESITIADMAGNAGISVSYECHRNTLTDTNNSLQALLKRVSHTNVFSYWQPLSELDLQARAEGLAMLKSNLSNIHVFYWRDNIRRPLEEGSNDWMAYFNLISDQKIHYAMLEFVLNDDKQQFLRDAQTLRRISSLINQTKF